MDNFNDNKHNELLYVNCYAKKNIMCNSISKIKNGMCDKCYKDIKHTLSEKELFDNYMSIKPIIVLKIKELLNNCENTIGKKNKALQVLHIYDIFYHNVYFSFSSVKFIKTYINKIVEIIKHDIIVVNEVVDEQLNNNNTYVDILDFMINIYEYYKDIKFSNFTDEEFLSEYNNFMKDIYNSICSKYNNEQSVNKENKQDEKEKEEENINNTFYQNLKSIQIDV